MLVLLVLLGAGIYAAANARDIQLRATEERERLENELLRLEQRAEGLEEDITRLEDPRGIEEELRRRYNVAKEGEEVVVLLEEGADDVATDTTFRTQPKGFLERIHNWFTNE